MRDLSLTQKFAEIYPELVAVAGVTMSDEPLSQRTTLHVGGQPIATVTCTSIEAIVAVVTTCDANHIPVLIVGGGSNLVIADGTVDCVAVLVACDEITVNLATGLVQAEAGAVWDEVVELAVASGLGGIECLSGIPGSAGAVPVQNVGAYGAEVSDVLTRVRLLHRDTGIDEWVPASELELAYRYSNLKFTSRAVVLAIEMQLNPDGLSAPLRYGELARSLGATAGGQRQPATQVREAVLALRRAKGMVYDVTDHDTWSAGSFFTNPVVDAERAEQIAARFPDQQVPRYPVAGTEEVKMSAAWLIQHAGFDKGFTLPPGRAGLSTKHTLALTNRGEATTADIVDLARHVRAGVAAEFGVLLEPEPVWIGIEI
ncbi:UDP-N-acetylmuramate dehydrogenase [Corynebacterium epidermidicanis]|uniref:UDP-N-acetylenolpyruvoylglucosamine reductase n=1 Tax=Corynebacterium epidermidicanis TaxID=1050174 RepID=A0A0G3GSF5_9CORY|nr:UDP-N-acetylmuramate dehydrogenase [Corynebacterium epidermidicanis]AKK04064.1 UDP-N-acetylmuramate dehydrogenase [Corynebacterium epidermidicanis]